jgi:hypothetical protein
MLPPLGGVILARERAGSRPNGEDLLQFSAHGLAIDAGGGKGERIQNERVNDRQCSELALFSKYLKIERIPENDHGKYSRYHFI